MFLLISQVYLQLIGLLEKFSNTRHWMIKLAFFCMAYAIFVSFPSVDLLDKDFKPSWDCVFEKAEHPLTQQDFAPESHQAKLTFRLFVPVLIRIFHLDIWGVIILKLIVGILTAYVFCRIVLKYTNDKILAILLTLCMTCTNFLRASSDVSGTFDSFAFFFLLLPFLFTNAAIVFISVFFGSWVDERGLIASSLLFLFFCFYLNGRKKWISCSAIVLAWAAYFALRFYLAHTYQLPTHATGTGFSVLAKQLGSVLLSAWMSLEGLWIIVLAGLYHMYKEKMHGKWLFYSGNILLILLVSLCVLDISRSLNYLMPAVILALPVSVRHETAADLRKLGAIALLLCFLFPAYTIGGVNIILWQYPLPLQLYRIFFFTQ